MSDTEKSEIIEMNNKYFNNVSMLQLRLNTNEIISKIEIFLRGCIIDYGEDETGKIISRKIKIGLPKANDNGIQSILSYINSLINSQTVQGNFQREECRDYISRVNRNLIDMLINNTYRWEIDDDDIEPICDFIMDMLEPFMTRLIDNKERDSYSNTMRHVESNTMQKDSGFSFLKK